MDQLEKMKRISQEVTMSEMARAIISYAGPFDDPRIGWSGMASNSNVFKCERCGAEHTDCTKINHKEDCSALLLLGVLSKLRKLV